METAAVSPPILPAYLWHHKVHEALGERLHFWRLSFAPVYLRDAALAGIKAALAAHDVKSAAVYEMLGPFDVLLRLWLPEGCKGIHFSQTLEEELKPHGLYMLDEFSVAYVVRHWAFTKKRKGPASPDDQAINELIRNPEKIEDLERETLSRNDSEELKRRKLVAFPDNKKADAPGIKFALFVGGSSYPDLDGYEGDSEAGQLPTLTKDDRNELEDLVMKVVSDADTIKDRSLYAGEGFGHFLVLGRVAYKNFHDIHAKLVTQLGAAPLRERFCVSTMTLISGQRGLRLFTESLVTSQFIPTTPAIGPNATETLRNLDPGDMFAERFEIVESLGEGGFGVVYHVIDHREGGVDRALKLFPSSNSETAQHEVTILRKIKSPYVVEMIWGERHPGTGWWYLVSEFVNGDTLKEYIDGQKAGQMTDREVVETIRQLLLGLEAVHPDDERKAELAELNRKRDLTNREWEELLELGETGIIHRDVTPANIMITPRGVKLIDFNIASQAGEEVDTDTRTPRYAPPGGWSDRIWSPRVDLYATGVILYELLCNGMHPYGYPDTKEALIDPAEQRADLTAEQLQLLRTACTVNTCFLQAKDMRDALERAWGPIDPLTSGSAESGD